jgi:hypothetical protein
MRTLDALTEDGTEAVVRRVRVQLKWVSPSWVLENRRALESVTEFKERRLLLLRPRDGAVNLAPCMRLTCALTAEWLIDGSITQYELSVIPHDAESGVEFGVDRWQLYCFDRQDFFGVWPESLGRDDIPQ